MVKPLAGQFDMFDLLFPPQVENATYVTEQRVAPPLSYISMCSGIESASVAAHPLGWRPIAFSEIEPFPSAVLAHHYPTVPNLGDMTKVDWTAYRGKADVVVAGTPCQSFSLAGSRRGLADHRGNLSLVFAQAVDAINPDFVIWENVPGVLSSKDNAFGCFLAGLAGEDEPLVAPGGKWTNAGYVLGPKRSVAWRILDAKHFGVPQRRRRVFVVASPRNGADPRAILFESESVRGNPAAGRGAGEIVAALTSNGVGTCGADDNQAQAGHLIAMSVAPRGREGGATAELGDDVAGCLRAFTGGGDKPHVLAPVAFRTSANCGAWSTGDRVDALTTGTDSTSHLVAYPILEAGARTGVSTTDIRAGIGIGGPQDPMFTLQAGKQHAVAVPIAFSVKDYGADATKNLSPTLRAMPHDSSHPNGDGQMGIMDSQLRVRRLTPTECERLQGFEPNYTNVPYRGKPAADGPRYKALGNSKAVPVVRWIFSRIATVAARSVRDEKDGA